MGFKCSSVTSAANSPAMSGSVDMSNDGVELLRVYKPAKQQMCHGGGSRAISR